MSTSIVKHIIVSDDANKPITIYLNDKGDVFMHENEGGDISDFWTCISYEDWLEVVKFIDTQKIEANV